MKTTPVDCSVLTGTRFRDYFGLPLTPETLEVLVREGFALPAAELHRREEESVTVLDWKQDGIAYSAGLQHGGLIFVSLHFEAGLLSAGQVLACLGAPQRCQAWYDAYPEINASSIQAVLMYIDHQLVAYGSSYLPFAAPQPPPLDDSLPVGMINLFGPDWAEHERSSSQSQPWPGSWQGLSVRVIQH